MEDTFSSIHEEIVVNTFRAQSSVSAVNFAEFADIMAVIVISQILSVWALVWAFDLEANSINLEGVGWNAGQTCSSSIESLTKITNFNALVEIVWNISAGADNLNAFGLNGVVLISPNTLDAFSTDFHESLTERVRSNTVKFVVDELISSRTNLF